MREVVVNLSHGEQRTAEHRARHPDGQLPVLRLPDGSFLTESLVILEYLEERWPEPPLVGRSPEERARTRELERVAELGVLHPISFAVHTTRSPLGLPPMPEVAAFELSRLPRGLARLDAALADGRPFLAGERPTSADCTLAAALQFARFGKLALPDGHPHLAAWDARYRAREPARAVLVL